MWHVGDWVDRVPLYSLILILFVVLVINYFVKVQQSLSILELQDPVVSLETHEHSR